jgi:hypothetical protein
MVQLCSFWTDLDSELQVRERSFAVFFTMSLLSAIVEEADVGSGR